MSDVDQLPLLGQPWLVKWLGGSDTGASSLVIMAHFVSTDVLALFKAQGRLRVPSDAGDIGRCIRLLDLAGQNGCNWRLRLCEMAYIPDWAPLLPRWSEIEDAYHEDMQAQKAWSVEVYTSEKTRRPIKQRRMIPMPPSRCLWLLGVLRGSDPYARQNPHPFDLTAVGR